MRIAVVTPAYNVAGYIGFAVRSLIAQSHEDWTLTVVDDGSTDGTADVAEGFGDPRIHVVGQPNAGVAAARNHGIAEADGDAFLFLDADDWLAPGALARLARALETRDATAVYGPYAFVPDTAKPGAAPLWVKSGPFPEGDILEPLLRANLFANGGHLLIRREAVERAGGFRAGIAFGEDWEYWVRLALEGPFTVAPGEEPLLFVRQRRGSAYFRMATDLDAFTPCMDAIFSNPGLIARLGASRCARLRRRAEAENQWIVGREMMRHGRAGDARPWLRRSVRLKPSLRRAALLAAAFALPVLPPTLHGPFRRYEAA